MLVPYTGGNPLTIQDPIKVIYIRTSSKSAFKKDSPGRQLLLIKQETGLYTTETFKERESSSVPLEERTEWNKLLEFARERYGNVIVFVESLSRLGRSLYDLDYQKRMIHEKEIQGIYALDTPRFMDPDQDWGTMRVILSEKKENDKQFLIRALQLKREAVRNEPIGPDTELTSQGKPRFDGRRLITNVFPKVKEIVLNMKKERHSWKEIHKEVNNYKYNKNATKLSLRTLQRIHKRGIHTSFIIKKSKDQNTEEKEKVIKKWYSKINQSSLNKARQSYYKGVLERTKQDNTILIDLFLEQIKSKGQYQKYVESFQSYYKYNYNGNVYWTKIPDNEVKYFQTKELGRGCIKLKTQLKQGLKLTVFNKEIIEEPGKINVKNGIWCTKEQKLLEHNPSHITFSQLPYNIKSDEKYNHEELHKWFLFVSDDRNDIVDQFYTKFYIKIHGITKYQVFFEFYGPGGTGKSTFTNICQALLPNNASVVTNIRQLESSRFESANLFGKRLILIPDSSTYTGEMAQIKAISGQDPLRFEEKNKQARSNFVVNGIIIITMNEAQSSKDYSTGLSRRRISIPFKKKPSTSEQNEILLIRSNDKWVGKFEPCIEPLLNHVIKKPLKLVEERKLNRRNAFPSVVEDTKKVLIETNPVYGFIREFVRLGPTTKFRRIKHWGISLSRTHKQKRNTKWVPEGITAEFEWDHNTQSLYCGFKRYCKHYLEGVKPISLSRFSSLFLDNLKVIYPDVEIMKGRTSSGTYYIIMYREKNYDDVFNKDKYLYNKEKDNDKKSESKEEKELRDYAVRMIDEGEYDEYVKKRTILALIPFIIKDRQAA